MIQATITTPTVSPASELALRHWLDRNGWKVTKLHYVAPRGRPRASVSDADIRALRAEGKSFRAIAAAVEMTESGVRYRMRSL